MNAIRNKKQFYRLWRQGLLGNRPRTWKDAAELERSGYQGKVTVRSSKLTDWKTLYRVSVSEALILGRAELHLTFNESMPDEVLTLQGEVMRSHRELELTYSTQPGLAMKEAMKESTKVSGVVALGILHHFLRPASQEELWELLDRYPDHVVEFSAYDRAVGELPHRNAVVWEVRSY